jgi:transposase
MAKHPIITLADHLRPEELKQRYRTCANAREARRWHALWLLSLDHPIGEVAELLGLHRNGVRKLLKRYNALGPDAVPDQVPQRPKGPPPALTDQQQQELQLALAQRPADGGIWTGPKVAAWIAARTGRNHVHPQLGWVYLRKLGLTPKTPRPQHAHAATAEQQTAWKKN